MGNIYSSKSNSSKISCSAKNSNSDSADDNKKGKADNSDGDDVLAAPRRIPKSTRRNVNTNRTAKALVKSCSSDAVSPSYLSLSFDEKSIAPLLAGDNVGDPDEALTSLKRSIEQWPALLKILPLLAEHGGCIAGEFVASALKGVNAAGSDDVEAFSVDVWLPNKERAKSMTTAISQILLDKNGNDEENNNENESKKTIARNLGSFSVFTENNSHVLVARKSDKRDMRLYRLKKDIETGMVEEEHTYVYIYDGVDGLTEDHISPHALKYGDDHFITRVESIQHFEIYSTDFCESGGVPIALPLFFHPFTIDYSEFKKFGKRFCDACDADTTRLINEKSCPKCACGWYSMHDMICKVLKQVHPSLAITKDASRFICEILDRMCNRIMTVATEIKKKRSDDEIIGSCNGSDTWERDMNDVFAAFDVVLYGDLARFSFSECNKSLKLAVECRESYENPSSEKPFCKTDLEQPKASKVGGNNKRRKSSTAAILLKSLRTKIAMSKVKSNSTIDNRKPHRDHPIRRSMVVKAASNAGLQFDPEIFLTRMQFSNRNSTWEASVVLAACAEFIAADLIELGGYICFKNKMTRITSQFVMQGLDAELLKFVYSLRTTPDVLRDGSPFIFNLDRRFTNIDALSPQHDHTQQSVKSIEAVEAVDEAYKPSVEGDSSVDDKRGEISDNKNKETKKKEKKQSIMLQVFEAVNLKNFSSTSPAEIFRKAIESYDPACRIGITVSKSTTVEGGFNLTVCGSGLCNSLRSPSFPIPCDVTAGNESRLQLVSDIKAMDILTFEKKNGLRATNNIISLGRIQMLLQGRGNCGMLTDCTKDDVLGLLQACSDEVQGSIRIYRGLSVIHLLCHKFIFMAMDFEFCFELLKTLELEETF